MAQTSKAQIDASIRYNKKRDSITIRPDKETGARIREEAKRRGMSRTELILKAVDEYLLNNPT